jgi:hypothetical protein
VFLDRGSSAVVQVTGATSYAVSPGQPGSAAILSEIPGPAIAAVDLTTGTTLSLVASAPTGTLFANTSTPGDQVTVGSDGMIAMGSLTGTIVPRGFVGVALTGTGAGDTFAISAAQPYTGVSVVGTGTNNVAAVVGANGPSAFGLALGKDQLALSDGALLGLSKIGTLAIVPGPTAVGSTVNVMGAGQPDPLGMVVLDALYGGTLRVVPMAGSSIKASASTPGSGVIVPGPGAAMIAYQGFQGGVNVGGASTVQAASIATPSAGSGSVAPSSGVGALPGGPMAPSGLIASSDTFLARRTSGLRQHARTSVRPGALHRFAFTYGMPRRLAATGSPNVVRQPGGPRAVLLGGSPSVE